jgi:aspartyl-tRNA(Asn)/glutamyl-tRNA(Gln) amidotransferase subunit A
MEEIFNLSIKEINSKIVKKELSVFELTKLFLGKIEKLNPQIKAFLTIVPELALKEAQKIDQAIAREANISPLTGIPYCLKDNILIRGIKCTAGSKILANYIASYDATVVKRLKKENALFLGKTNMDEFAMGSSCENSAFFATKNPYDLTRVPGGSSGGSAAAVAAKMSVFGLGSDTGGSIRQPASFCGIVGFKPSYGMVSRFGLIAMASSLDQIGPFSKTVEDAEIVFEAISGKDKKDQTTTEIEKKTIILNPKKIKIGILKEFFQEGLEKEVKEEILKAIEKIAKEQIKIEEVSLPYVSYSLPVYYIIVPSEVSANLARYDGLRYGYFKEEKTKKEDLWQTYLRIRQEGFGDEVKRRIILGAYALSSGYYEAYYLRAQKVRIKIKEDFNKAFRKVDAILSPTSPTLPFKIGEKTADPLKMYLSDIFTVPASIAGLPAISLPCSFVNNLPVGLQLMGNIYEDRKLLALSKVVEEILK